MTYFTISILITLVLLFTLSRWRLWVGVIAAALAFALFNLQTSQIVVVFTKTIFSTGNWFMIIAVGLIPIMGNMINGSAHLGKLMIRLKNNKKLYLILAPLIFGLLPIPGGALLSCPLLKDFSPEITKERYVIINIWFRHLLIIVYPLSSSLIIGTQIAGLPLSKVILNMFPIAVLMFILGYIFILPKMGKEEHKVTEIINKDASIRKLLLSILSAPILHIMLTTTVLKGMEQFSFFISMMTAVSITVVTNKLSLKEIILFVRKSKIENFSLLFLCLLFFLNTIKQYEGFQTVFGTFVPAPVLMGVLGFILSYVTGRIEIALSIVFPLIFAAYIDFQFTTLYFVYIYFSLFAGYLISPLHPCMVFTLEYFESSYFRVMRYIFPLLLLPLTILALLVFLK